MARADFPTFVPAEPFVPEVHRASLIVASNAEALLAAVAAFDPPQRKYDPSPEAVIARETVTTAEA